MYMTRQCDVNIPYHKLPQAIPCRQGSGSGRGAGLAGPWRIEIVIPAALGSAACSTLLGKYLGIDNIQIVHLV